MTDQPTTPTPAKKRGRPRKATAPDATTPQESPVAESKSEVRTQVPEVPEIDTQRVMTMMLHANLARHMTRDHRMSWGETRISLGYGVANQDPQQDELWDTVYRMAKA